MSTATVCRCPKCGSTNAYEDESRSMLEFTHMQCDGCGYGGLCDSYERDADWYVEVQLPADGTVPAHVAPLEPGGWFYESLQRVTARRAAAKSTAQSAPPIAPPNDAPTATTGKVAQAPLVATAPSAGCARCLAEPDAAKAWDGFTEAGRVYSLVDESHFDIQLRRCASCGTHFAQVFTERVDWVNGEDDQLWLVVAVTPEDVEQLRAASVDDVPSLLESLARDRRFLVRSHPSGSSVSTWWRESGFSIGPHD